MKNRRRVLHIDTYHPQTYFLLIMIWLLFMSMVFMQPTIVEAHSALVRSEPQDGDVLDNSPAKVTAWFSEELDSEYSTMRVFDSQNNQVDQGDGGVDLNDLDHLSMVAGLPPLVSGTYKVAWTAVSAEDGDPTQGEFTFSVGGGDVVGESTGSSGSGTPILLISGTIVLLVIVVFIWFFFLRKRTPG